MIQLKPGDTIVLEDGTPATVENVRWQSSRNGESAVAVVLAFGEAIITKVLTLRIEEAVPEVTGVAFTINADEVVFRTFLAEGVIMASPEVIAQIQERLKQQRDMMKVMISSSIQTPRSSGGGRVSESTRERQLERAKERRKQEREAVDHALNTIMEERKCTREDAVKVLEGMANP